MRLLAENRVNFAFETTLASRTFSTWIPKLKKEGYQFHLIFLWLKTVELAVSRVKERTKTGGHNVPEETVRRRYIAGLKNFFNLYRPLANSWQLYDNSDTDGFTPIASETNHHELIITNKDVWQKLLEVYSE